MTRDNELRDFLDRLQDCSNDEVEILKIIYDFIDSKTEAEKKQWQTDWVIAKIPGMRKAVKEHTGWGPVELDSHMKDIERQLRDRYAPFTLKHPRIFTALIEAIKLEPYLGNSLLGLSRLRGWYLSPDQRKARVNLTLYKAWDKLHQYEARNDASFKTWCGAILRNTAIDMYKADLRGEKSKFDKHDDESEGGKTKKGGYLAGERGARHYQDRTGDPKVLTPKEKKIRDAVFEQAYSEEVVSFVLHCDDLRIGSGAKTALTPYEHNVFTMRYFDGLKYKEIAERLNKGTSTISNTLRRAEDKIGGLLEIHEPKLYAWFSASRKRC